MADFVAGLPVAIGYFLGAGLFLFLASRVALAAARRFRNTVGGLLLIYSIMTVVILVINSRNEVNSQDVVLNCLAAATLFAWDCSRLRNKRIVTMNTQGHLAGKTEANK
jgi:hypothetical protein